MAIKNKESLPKDRAFEGFDEAQLNPNLSSQDAGSVQAIYTTGRRKLAEYPQEIGVVSLLLYGPGNPGQVSNERVSRRPATLGVGRPEDSRRMHRR